MLRKKFAIISFVIASLMGGVAASAQSAQQMENGVWVDGFRIGNSRTGRMVLFFFAENNNGKLSVCGNYYLYGGGSGLRRFQRALNSYRFFYNGRYLMTNASFLWRAPSEDRIGDEVGCSVTDIPFVANANDLLGGDLAIAR